MSIEFLTLADRRLAYQRQVGDPAKPGIVFLGGFASDMMGSKAVFLAQTCAAAQIGFVRFDYSGCGQSPGTFTDGTIGRWRDDALAIFDQLTIGPQIIIGSSMGGWIALLLAQARAERVKALIGVAAAPDFTEDLIWDKLALVHREALLRDGKIYEENAPPDHRFPITLQLIEEARHHLVLRTPLPIACPLRLLQGMKDSEVPWHTAERLAAHVAHDDVCITLIKNGDHRLSTSGNLELLRRIVAEFI